MKQQSRLKIILVIVIVCITTIAFSLNQRQIGVLLEQSTVKINTYLGNQIVTFGSGFLISQNGFIGTNYHVIEFAILRNARIFVESPDQKQRREAQIINWDQFLDFAILKIDMNGMKGLQPLRLGDSEKMKPLDNVYVAGFPVTGAFKAQKGDLNSMQKLNNKSYLDISVPIDRGDSGGPVVDTDGNLVGVSVAFMTTARSMNLAIKSNDIKNIIQRSMNGSRKAVIWDGREREKNDDKFEANLIVQGLLIEGTLDSKDVVDWFEIAGQESVYPRITISHATGNNFDFEVYSDNSFVCKATSTSPQDGVQCQVPGRCYIKVMRITGSGSYSLQITPQAQGQGQSRFISDDGREIEPNNGKYIANRTRSLTLMGNLDSSDTEDWFELEGQEGVTPSFTISHSNKADFNFEVYSDNTLACSALGTGSTDRISCTVPGRCYVKVWRVYGEGNYVIRIELGNNLPH